MIGSRPRGCIWIRQTFTDGWAHVVDDREPSADANATRRECDPARVRPDADPNAGSGTSPESSVGRIAPADRRRSDRGANSDERFRSANGRHRSANGLFRPAGTARIVRRMRPNLPPDLPQRRYLLPLPRVARRPVGGCGHPPVPRSPAESPSPSPIPRSRRRLLVPVANSSMPTPRRRPRSLPLTGANDILNRASPRLSDHDRGRCVRTPTGRPRGRSRRGR